MPLIVETTFIQDFETRVKDAGGSQTLGIVAMVIGIPQWTGDNIDEVWTRISFMEKTTGSFRMGADEYGEFSDLSFTKAEVTGLIGLRTNATPITKAKYIRHVWDLHERWVQ